MNNRIQQSFDKSIREAVETTQRVADAKHEAGKAHPVERPKMTAEEKRANRRKPKGRLYLCPETGATIWDPAG
jgi:hypothetical protein